MSFRPPVWGVLSTLLVLSGLLSLGFWQLDRATQKADLLKRFNQYDVNAYVALTPELTDVGADVRYMPVTAKGRFLPNRHWLLENQIENGRAGVHVISALLLTSGHVLLVNRGWVPMTPQREVSTELEQDFVEVEIRGRLNMPPTVGWILEAPEQTAWPHWVQVIDVNEVARSLGKPVLPMIVQLDGDQSGGFVRNWKVVHFGPERHRGYAVQWFGLATALMAIFIVVNIQREQGVK